ncbi:MAG TPA: ATP-binding protein, partial [Lacipirellulaceae bacterium]|nr:ATP-binding protein [Lacipirellulaceae bacterium]
LQADFARLAEKLIEQSTRAADIVRRLRRFASRREPRSAPVHLNQLVREVEQLMRFHANRFAIRMKLNLAPDLPPVLADSLLIEQVLVNLLRNSFEAMSEAKTPNAMVSMSTACEDRTFVEIAVADHGPGFGDAPLEQLFEAFFTTKPSGMGLGLVISRSIVQAHGGTLTASPNPAGGALFRLRLPVCDQAA